MLAGTTLLFALAFSFHHLRSRQALLSNAETNARQIAYANVNRIAAVLAGVEQAPRLLARAIEERKPHEDELAVLLRSALLANSDLFGTAAAFEPGRFSPDRRLFAPYCYRKNGSLASAWLGQGTEYFVLDW